MPAPFDLCLDLIRKNEGIQAALAQAPDGTSEEDMENARREFAWLLSNAASTEDEATVLVRDIGENIPGDFYLQVQSQLVRGAQRHGLLLDYTP
jgi:hypothetical protein